MSKKSKQSEKETPYEDSEVRIPVEEPKPQAPPVQHGKKLLLGQFMADESGSIRKEGAYMEHGFTAWCRQNRTLTPRSVEEWRELFQTFKNRKL